MDLLLKEMIDSEERHKERNSKTCAGRSERIQIRNWHSRTVASGEWQAERQKLETRNSKLARTETGKSKFETGVRAVASDKWRVASNGKQKTAGRRQESGAGDGRRGKPKAGGPLPFVARASRP